MRQGSTEESSVVMVAPTETLQEPAVCTEEEKKWKLTTWCPFQHTDEIPASQDEKKQSSRNSIEKKKEMVSKYLHYNLILISFELCWKVFSSCWHWGEYYLSESKKKK